MKSVFALAALLAGLFSAAAFGQQAPFYGQHLSGEYGLYDQSGARVCTVRLTDQFNQLRETFQMDARDCPEPIASAARWELERGMGTGRHQIAFWSGGFTPAWRGAVPSREAEVWVGEGSDGTSYQLRPESERPRAWLRGEPQAQRRALEQANRLRPGDLLGVYRLSPRNGYPRECYLTLFRGPNGGGRVRVEGEGCGPFANADRFRYQQGRVVIFDRRNQGVWGGDVRRPDGAIRIVGGDRQIGQWELNRLGAALPRTAETVTMETLAGRWTFEENGARCAVTLLADGRVDAAFACEDPAQLFGSWRLEGDLVVISDSSVFNPSDIWRGRVVDMNTIEGRGTDVMVGLPPRRVGRSALRR
ncbi:MAG: hypothetical protein ABL308_08055 [Oceanicaulis sp.]